MYPNTKREVERTETLAAGTAGVRPVRTVHVSLIATSCKQDEIVDFDKRINDSDVALGTRALLLCYLVAMSSPSHLPKVVREFIAWIGRHTGASRQIQPGLALIRVLASHTLCTCPPTAARISERRVRCQ